MTVRRVLSKLDGYFSSDAMSSRQLLGIFLPLLWEQLFFAGVAMLSSWMLSVEGEAAVSAVNMINVSNAMFTAMCLAVATGGTVVVAQYAGANHHDMALRTLQQTISASTLAALLLGGALLLGQKPVVDFLLSGAPAEVMDYAVTYFFGVCFSLPLYAFYQSFAGCMRGWGRTKTAMTLTISINCMELVLTAVFVLGLRLNVMGIALAMIISRGVGCITVCLYMFRHRREMDLALRGFLQPNLSILRSLAIIALPVALEQVFFSGGKALSQRFIASYGTTHMVAYAVFNVVSTLFNAPHMAMCSATLTVVGMCIGKRRIDLATGYIRKFVATANRLTVALIALFIPISIGICFAYGLSPESRRIAYIGFAIFFVGAPLFWARSFMLPNGLRAGGDALYTSIVALSSMWAVRVALSFVFTRLLPLGVIGLILAMVLEWSVRGIIFSRRLRTDRWYQHKVINTDSC